jgi:hypothetical protein
MDPANVSWFFGTYAVSVASYVLLSTIPAEHHSLWIFLASLGLFASYAAASGALRRLGWPIPSGLAAALAVSVVPAVTVGFLKVIRVWPDSLGNPFTHFSGYTLAVAVVTAVAGLAAFVVTRFPFVLALVVTAILLAAQLVAASGSTTADDRATAALVTGAVVVVVGVLLDAAGRRRDAFWFHTLGWLSVAAGLVFFTVGSGGDPDRGWVPMLVVGVLMLLVAGPLRRATWAVYGVLGYYAPIVHYMLKGLDESRWPFAVLLLVVGVSIFALGTVLYRYTADWRDQRFASTPS